VQYCLAAVCYLCMLQCIAITWNAKQEILSSRCVYLISRKNMDFDFLPFQDIEIDEWLINWCESHGDMILLLYFHMLFYKRQYLPALISTYLSYFHFFTVLHTVIRQQPNPLKLQFPGRVGWLYCNKAFASGGINWFKQPLAWNIREVEQYHKFPLNVRQSLISLRALYCHTMSKLNLKREHKEVSWIIYKVQGKVSTPEEMEAEKWRWRCFSL
jgi:hypothetical protein